MAAASLILNACGGGEPASRAATPGGGRPAGAPSAAAANAPDPGGKIISIEMTTDEKGVNKFTPAQMEARKGDLLRFSLVTGVHNVHFLPDSNPPGAKLPPQGQMLQLPGQIENVKVTLDPGRYYFQCDPHALLGMVGWLTVR